MPEEKSHTEQGQVERARRLREQIQRLRTGATDSNEPPREKSLREQVEERAAALKKKDDAG